MVVDPTTLNWKNYLTIHLNFIIIYSLKVIKPSFSDWKTFLVDQNYVHFLQLKMEKSINYVLQIFSDNGLIKIWHEFKRDHNVDEILYSKWL